LLWPEELHPNKPLRVQYPLTIKSKVIIYPGYLIMGPRTG
jgi:hypothetical protein